MLHQFSERASGQWAHTKGTLVDNCMNVRYEARVLDRPADPVTSGWHLLHDEDGEAIVGESADEVRARIGTVRGDDIQDIVVARIDTAYLPVVRRSSESCGE